MNDSENYSGRGDIEVFCSVAASLGEKNKYYGLSRHSIKNNGHSDILVYILQITLIMITITAQG